MKQDLKTLLAAHPPRAMSEADVVAVDLFDTKLFPGYPYGPYFWEDDIRTNPGGTEIVRVSDDIDGVVACGSGHFKPSRSQPGKKYGEIVSIAVDDRYKGIGLGELMLSRCLERLFKQPITGVVLQTHVQNKAMQRLAEKHGFTITRTIPNYYPNGVRDAYEMTRHA